MASTHRLVVPMVPALETNKPAFGLADVATVPAVRVQIAATNRVIVVAGLIDTGAELSTLSKAVADDLHLIGGTAPEHSVPVTTNFANVPIQLYHIGMRILGTEANSGIDFESVPVTVGKSSRPPLILGRRGLLERMRIDLDFPRRCVAISIPRTGTVQYPHLAQMCPSLPMIISLIEDGRIAEAVMLLAWDFERTADRMLAANPAVTPIRAARSKQPGTLRDKLIRLTDYQTDSFVKGAVQVFSDARNRAAHGKWFKWDNDAQGILMTAEAIASSLKGAK